MRAAQSESVDLGSEPSLASSLLLMLSVWLALGVPQVFAATAGEAGLLIGFGAATLALLRWRPRREVGWRPLPIALGIASGFASYPAWIATIAWIGLALGLPISERVQRVSGGPPAVWLCAAVLGPIFEELLYRERILAALRPYVGALGAVFASSALFAISHIRPWSVLGTFCVGLLLGLAYVAGRSIALCVALHTGVNVACLWCGMPPAEPCLSPIPSAMVGSSLMLAALILVREGPWSGLLPSPPVTHRE